jgi:hypothetical protein
MRIYSRFFLTILVFALVFYLPVVPIAVAPVVPAATATVRYRSIQNILGFLLNAPDGVSYQWLWSTYVVMLVLVAAGCLAGALMFRRNDSPLRTGPTR